MACDKWRIFWELVQIYSYKSFLNSLFSALLAKKVWSVRLGFSPFLFYYLTARAAPKWAENYSNKSGSFGHQALNITLLTLNSAYVRRTETKRCNFFVSIFFNIRKNRPQLNFNLKRGLAIFLGSKKIDLEQRCNFPSILNLELITIRTKTRGWSSLWGKASALHCFIDKASWNFWEAVLF